MANEVTIIVRTIDSTKPGLESATSGFKGFAGIAGTAGMAIGAVLVGVGVKATEMAANFNASMERLVTQAGVSQAKMESLKGSVLSLAGQVGFSPDSLAESLYHVASNMQSMGASSQQMMDVVKTAAQGAAIGGANLVDVTNALTAAVASGIPGVQNYGQAMGTLNAIVGTGDMKMQDLAEAFGTGMVAVVKGFGLSLTDVGAALAVFGDNNIRGATAGTQLRMAVQALASPMKAGQEQLVKIGITSGQLAKDMQSGGLLKALEDLKSHMDAAGISANQQGQIITDAFGKKAGTGLNILIGQMDRVTSKYSELDKGAAGFSDAWSKTNDTLKQKWNDIKAAFDSVMVRIGDGINKFINLVTQAFSKGPGAEMLNAIRQDWDRLSNQIKANWPEIKTILEAFGVVLYGIVLAILAIIDVLLKIDSIMVYVWARAVDAVAMFTRSALATLGFFVDGAARAFGWIPGIGPKLVAAAKSFDDFSAKVNSALNRIQNKTVDVNIQTYVTGSGAKVIENQGVVSVVGHGLVKAFAHGGVVGAASGMVRNGLSLVGEHGAELVDLPSGSTVHSNPDTQRMLSQNQPSSRSVNYQTIYAGDELTRQFVIAIQRYVRGSGGDGRTLGIVTVNG